MSAANEVEIKFPVAEFGALEAKLRALGFAPRTPRTHELNTLYDLPGGVLRSGGEVLRLRHYGEKWVLTHKARGEGDGRHKSRRELETEIGDGAQLDAILRALGFAPSFVYEKFRSEWADATGHGVLDETPIGDFGEIEGPPAWIDRTAAQLGIATTEYITDSYAALFSAWRAATRSAAAEMTFAAVQPHS